MGISQKIKRAFRGQVSLSAVLLETATDERVVEPAKAAGLLDDQTGVACLADGVDEIAIEDAFHERDREPAAGHGRDQQRVVRIATVFPPGPNP